MLEQKQIDFFWQNGFVVVDNVVTAKQLKALKDDFNHWVEHSRSEKSDYGQIKDGRARFDLEDGHTSSHPRLRRVAAPIEVSEAYMEVSKNSAMVDVVADLIGPNIKLHHTKINSKLPGTNTEVKWHQDFPFTPHSNDDLVTALLFVDEVTLQNGPLEVAPGSHRESLHSIWHDGVFTGAVANGITEQWLDRRQFCTGPAGSCCFMHTRLGHGSAANQSSDPRTLYISVYSAEDAIPLSRNPVPHEFEGMLVRGQATGKLRSMEYNLTLPQYPATTSFFAQQEAAVDS